MTDSPKYSSDSDRMLLPESFYLDADVLQIAQKLLGKVIVTNIAGIKCSARIVETEAYRAPEDQASHAKNHTRTSRTEIMYARGGHIYVYLCYGIHHLFNIVTGPKDVPHAVLIRAVEPLENTDIMLQRRKLKVVRPQLSAGPGVLSKALGIRTYHNGLYLHHPHSPIRIEECKMPLPKSCIQSSTRVGIDYSGDWALKPWRYFIKDNPYVSKAKGASLSA